MWWQGDGTRQLALFLRFALLVQVSPGGIWSSEVESLGQTAAEGHLCSVVTSGPLLAVPEMATRGRAPGI